MIAWVIRQSKVHFIFMNTLVRLSKVEGSLPKRITKVNSSLIFQPCTLVFLCITSGLEIA